LCVMGFFFFFKISSWELFAQVSIKPRSSRSLPTEYLGLQALSHSPRLFFSILLLQSQSNLHLLLLRIFWLTRRKSCFKKVKEKIIFTVGWFSKYSFLAQLYAVSYLMHNLTLASPNHLWPHIAP
jgi:hypothetical protein